MVNKQKDGKKKQRKRSMFRTWKNKRRNRGYGGVSRAYGGAINVHQSPLPENYKTILRYTEYDKMDIQTSNLADALIMCCNGLYDPNATSVGHQPRGFDQLCAFYGKYIVLGSRITIEMYNTNTFPVQVGYCLTTAPAGKTYMSDYMEGMTDVQYQTLGGVGSSGDKYKAVINFSPKKFFKVKNLTDNPNFYGYSLANPTQQAYCHFFTAGQSYTTGAPNSVWVTITAEYITLWKEPIIVPAS